MINFISFGSLRENKIAGEKVLRDLRQDFGYLQSGTRLQQKVFSHTFPPKYIHLLRPIADRGSALNRELYGSERRGIFQGTHNSLDEAVEAIGKLVKKLGIANCGEYSILVQHALEKRGLDPQNFKMIVDSLGGPDPSPDHFATVIGLKKGARLDSPKTWGNQAVVVDAWSGISMEARAAIDHYLKILSGGRPILGISFLDGNLTKFFKIKGL